MIEDFDFVVDSRGVRTLREPRSGWPREMRWLSGGMLKPQFELIMGKAVKIGKFTLQKDPHGGLTVVQWERDRVTHYLEEEIAFSNPLDAVRYATATDYWDQREKSNG